MMVIVHGNYSDGLVITYNQKLGYHSLSTSAFLRYKSSKPHYIVQINNWNINTSLKMNSKPITQTHNANAQITHDSRLYKRFSAVCTNICRKV